MTGWQIDSHISNWPGNVVTSVACVLRSSNPKLPSLLTPLPYVLQGPTPDQSLVGKTLEVRWRYHHKTTGEPVYMWCEGEVIQVRGCANPQHSHRSQSAHPPVICCAHVCRLLTEKTDKKSARCKKVLPAGALRIKWPADVDFDEDESYVWSMLHPKSFNKDVHMGWRFAACELRRMEEAKQPAQAPKKRARK